MNLLICKKNEKNIKLDEIWFDLIFLFIAKFSYS